MSSVLQHWVGDLKLMQQTVLLTAIRGPDGVPKYGPTKMLLRWYRRCVVFSAMDRRVLADPLDPSGGSFTGPSVTRVRLASEFRDRKNREAAEFNEDVVEGGGEPMVISVEDDRDPWSMPHQELIDDQLRTEGWEELMHQLVDQYLRELDAIPHHFQLHFLHAAEIVGYKHPVDRVRAWWFQAYTRLVHDMHLWPETEEQLDRRLGDDRSQWLARNDRATVD